MAHFIWLSILLTLFIIVYKYLTYLRNRLNFWKERGVNGPKGIPLFGNILDVFKTPINLLELERAKKYGKIYGFMEMTQPWISISDAELIKLVGIRDFHNFQNHSNLSPGDPLLSIMLISAQSEDWKRMRNIMTPAFTNSKIKQMFNAVDRCVENTLSYFNEVAQQSKEIDLKQTFVSFTMDGIACCAFGIDLNSWKNPEGDFVRHCRNVTDFSTFRVILGFLLPSKLRQALGFQLFSPPSIAYFTKVLNHVLSEKQKSELNEKNFLSSMFKAEINDSIELQKLREDGVENLEIYDVKHETEMSKRRLTFDEILAQCFMILIAGTESASTCLQLIAYTFTKKPEIQEKLYKEIKHYFENENYDYDSLSSLPYLEAVIYETLRRYTPVSQFDRVCMSDYKLGDTGIVIPKGTVINMPYHAIHHDPDYWEDPFEFKPERFMPENKHFIKPCTFLPFGIGPRNCVGIKLATLEMKAMLAKLVYNFEIVKSKNTPIEPVFTGKKLVQVTKPMFATVKRRIK